MKSRFERSWQLFKASITATLRHRKLLWFPVVNTLLTGFIALFFISAMALPIVFQPTGYHLTQKEHWDALVSRYEKPISAQFQPKGSGATSMATHNIGQPTAAANAGQPSPAKSFNWYSLLLLPLYLVSMFLATFFNVAFYSEIISALNGHGVSIRRGLLVAWNRLPSILAWSLLAGIVGWLIRAIEERLPFAGRIMMGLVGMAWSVAAVFAIPVIIQQQPIRNPLKILQQSAMTLKRAWGEGLIGFVGFSAGRVLVMAGSLICLVLAGVLAVALKSVWFIVIAGAIWVFSILLIGYISSVAASVYRCALYLYAAEGVIPEPYSQELMDMAWKVKKI